MSVKGYVSSRALSLDKAGVRVGKLPSVEGGEMDRLGGGHLPHILSMALGLVPLLLPGVLLSSLCLTFGERRPHLLKPSNRKGHALLHSDFQSCGLGVHVANPALDLANPRGPMWTWGGWNRPQPLPLPGCGDGGAGWAGPRNLSLGSAPCSPRILALCSLSQPQQASALSGLASLERPHC